MDVEDDLNEMKIDVVKGLIGMYYKDQVINTPESLLDIINNVAYADTKHDVDEIVDMNINCF